MTDLKRTEKITTLNRLNDRLFKFIFASEQHKDLLILFLNNVLDEGKQIVDLEYMDRELTPFLEDGKLSHFDVRAKTEDGRIFHVEVQIADEEDFFKRCLFYVSNSYVTQIKVGNPYETLKPVIFVGILNFEMFTDKPDEYHSIHRLLDTKTHRCYCEDMEFHYLEIPKLRKMKKTPQTGLERMMAYMGSIGGAEGMKQLAKTDSDIERILKLEEIFVSNPEQWVGYLRRERAQTDYENSLMAKLEKGRKEGLKEGLQKGKQENKLETAKILLKMGMLTLEQISQATGLTKQELLELRNEG